MTKISWTDQSWNPITGCSKVSGGCRNCYAERLSLRFGHTGKRWSWPNASENVTIHEDRLTKPLGMPSGSKVFTASMGDLFHELAPEPFVNRVFAVMALRPDITFQVLTKRLRRMRDYIKGKVHHGLVDQLAFEFSRDELGTDPDARNWSTIPWPLNNVWLGTSVEDQRAADERIPYLVGTPAALRFLSCEPLLGEVDLGEYLSPEPRLVMGPDSKTVRCDHPAEHREGVNCHLCHDTGELPTSPVLYYPPSPIGWVIAGGESGPNHRDMDEDWARRIRDDCQAARVPFFFKQHSASRPEQDPYLDGHLYREIPSS